MNSRRFSILPARAMAAELIAERPGTIAFTGGTPRAA
jgi:hypothetical protein